MYSKFRHFELKYMKFKTNHPFFIELSKVSEVVNFRFLANLRFLTLPDIIPKCMFFLTKMGATVAEW